nr:mitochondrial import protein 1 [Quercus suber]POE72819.1 mitochondrial import protein 1 [Quercus suber]
MSSRGLLSESQTTFPSDSENYDASPSNQDSSDEQPSSASSPMILYSPPTVWSILRGAAINLLLPFVNGLMLGFGELFAHEAAFRLGWSGTKVSFVIDRATSAYEIFPGHRSSSGHRVGPGVVMREDPVERRRRDGEELDMYTSLE